MAVQRLSGGNFSSSNMSLILVRLFSQTSLATKSQTLYSSKHYMFRHPALITCSKWLKILGNFHSHPDLEKVKVSQNELGEIKGQSDGHSPQKWILKATPSLRGLLPPLLTTSCSVAKENAVKKELPAGSGVMSGVRECGTALNCMLLSSKIK